MSLILTHHLALITEVLVHFFDSHAVGLGSNVENHFRLVAFVVHGAIFESRPWCAWRVGIEVVAKAIDADTAEYTEDVALMFVEF